MHTFFRTAALAGLVISACFQTACNDNDDPDDKPVEGPKITLEAVETTPSTITFSITPTDATACAYMMLTPEQTVPTAALILSDGTEAESKKYSEETLYGLVPETTYVVVAAVTDGKTAIVSEPLSVTTKELVPPDDAVTLDHMIDATYYGVHPEFSSSANYYIQLANVSCTKDNVGYYRPDGDGTLLLLDLWGVPSPEGNLALPTGTYTLEGTKHELTINPYNTGIYVSKNGETSLKECEAGQVVVQRSGSNYTLTISLTEKDTKTEHHFVYTGQLPLTQYVPKLYEPIPENVNTTFTGADGIYFGEREKDGLGYFDLYLSDVPLEGGFLSEAGNMLVLKLVSPLLENGEDIYLPDGTYTVAAAKPAAFNFLSGYVPEGENQFPAGSLCEQDDEEGAPYYALLTGGTMEFHRSGTTYTAAIDLTTKEGITIKGSYSGEIPIEDKTGWKKGGGGYSTLHMDTTPDLSGITEAQLIYMGDYMRVDCSSFIMQIEAEGQPESMTIEVLCERKNDTDVATGHYTVMPGRALANYVPWAVLPGYITEQHNSGSWYFERDKAGEVLNYAPVNEGTLDITKEGDRYTVTYDFKDDCTEPISISGSWTGTMSFVSSPFSITPTPTFKPRAVEHPQLRRSTR